MATPKQMMGETPQLLMSMKSSGGLGYAGAGSPMAEDREEDITRSALSAFRAKEEDIERRRREVSDKVQAQLGRVEEQTKRLADIREELEGFGDPVGKEVAAVRKRIDVVSRELKPMGQTCQRKIRFGYHISTEITRTNVLRALSLSSGSSPGCHDLFGVEDLLLHVDRNLLHAREAPGRDGNALHQRIFFVFPLNRSK